MEWPGTVRRGRVMLSPPIAADRDAYMSKIKDGTAVVISVKRVSKGKSSAQLRYYFGLVVRTILEAFEDRGWDVSTFCPHLPLRPGAKVSVHMLQDMLYAAAGDVGENGGEKKTLSQMSSAEATEFIERVRDFAATVWDIVVPDPDIFWRN